MAKRSEPIDQTMSEADGEDLIACVELLFFAYRDFTAEPDAILERYGFGRAHHRVLHFVNRNQGLSVADLLLILKITKQSLARVLKQLIEKGFVVQKAGKEDKRQRLLFATAKGSRLALKLTELQIARIKEALSAAGPDSEQAIRGFLFAMVRDLERERVEELIGPRRSAKQSPPRRHLSENV